MKREHQLIWSTQYDDERAAVMAECERVVGIGGSFEIKHEWMTSNWYSIITIYYPDAKEQP